ncbi:NAD-dependent epimerase/dehydratase family protein [Candidatus Gracilibacteria bacterium]|nr:NAD-dependent epimerase/dehydratase family protein [Candidatus Gracilibacteria bacterium]
MKKKILVTGGAGFIGSNFCNINKDKYDIVALDNLFWEMRRIWILRFPLFREMRAFVQT